MKATFAAACVLSIFFFASVFAQPFDERGEVPLRDWPVTFPMSSDAGAREGAVAAASLPSVPSNFKAVTPCRVVDTRNAAGPYGGPAMAAGETRTFDIDSGSCSIPANGIAYSLNFTVVGPSTGGWIQVGPGGAPVPFVSTLNFAAGETVANAAIVPAGPDGTINVLAAVADLHLIIDINGYFPGATYLGSGETLRGTFTVEFTATAALQPGSSPISFAPNLAAAPQAGPANIILAGGSPTANCPGTSANPQAAPGQLCLYEAAGNATSNCLAKVGGVYSCGASDAWGTTYFLRSADAGRVFSVGTWAVTAP
jgi:hypothetical protein